MNIMKSIRSIVRRLFGGQPAGGRLAFYPYGFHGDRYLLELVGWIASQVELFIETGANVGSTLAYMGRTYPGLRCLSCEPDEAAYQASREHTASLQNVGLLQATSQTFLGQLSRLEPDIFERPVFFWLDAHGYGFEWPLRFELEWITSRFTSAFILIDDFKVPGREMIRLRPLSGPGMLARLCSCELEPGANLSVVLSRLYRTDFPLPPTARLGAAAIRSGESQLSA